MIRRAIKHLLNQGAGRVRSMYEKPRFQIKSGYTHRTQVVAFDDSENKDEWQKEVYDYGKKILVENDFTRVVDFGCGSGFKLMQNFSEVDTIGIELEPGLSILKEKYPNRVWKSFNGESKFTCDLLILSDVIEHVEKPDELLLKINELIDFKIMLISTPDRNLLNRSLPYGPPRNISHFREWSFQEFKLFVSNYFKVKNHFISNKEQATQLIECMKK